MSLIQGNTMASHSDASTDANAVSGSVTQAAQAVLAQSTQRGGGVQMLGIDKI